MKVEFLADGSPDCPLVRLYNFSDAELQKLCVIAGELANRQRASFQVDAESWVESIAHCQFRWMIGLHDRGAGMPSLGGPLTLELSTDGWLDVAERLSSLTGQAAGFQWLADVGSVNVLVSRDGRW